MNTTRSSTSFPFGSPQAIRPALLLAAATVAFALLGFFVLVVQEGVQRGTERQRQQMAGHWPQSQTARDQDGSMGSSRERELDLLRLVRR